MLLIEDQEQNLTGVIQMKLFCCFTVFLFSLTSWSQFPHEPQAQANGKLFSIHLTPKDKKARIYIVGKKAAHFDFKTNEAKLELFARQGTKQEKLEFTKIGDAFEVTELPKWQGPFELHLKGKIRKESESLKLDIP